MRRAGFLLSFCLISVIVIQKCDAVAAPVGNPADLAKRLIVMLKRGSTFGGGIIFGLFKDRLYVATARHLVVNFNGRVDKKPFTIFLSFLPGEEFQANVANESNEELDLAVLIVSNVKKKGVNIDQIPFHLLGDPALLQRGDEVYAIGYPNQRPWELPGTPDGFQSVLGKTIRFQTSFVRVGNSGGGLFDANWYLVGMVRDTGSKDSPSGGTAVPIDQILKQLAEWNFTVGLGGPETTQALTIGYRDLQLSDVDYLPTLYGVFGRNRIVLQIDAAGVTNELLMDIGRTSRGVIETKIGDSLEMRIVERGTMQNFYLTDAKLIAPNDLDKNIRYSFRILQKVFRDNPDIDPQRRDISFVLTGKQFDPDANSGPGREPAGATTIVHGKAYAGRLSFLDQTATNHVKLLGDTNQCAGIIWLKNPNGIETAIPDRDHSLPLEVLSDIPPPSAAWTLPCRKANPPVVRLHAAKIQSATGYIAAVVEPQTKDVDFAAFLVMLISDQAKGYDDGSKLGDLVPVLRRRFGISFEAMVQFLNKNQETGDVESQGKGLVSIVRTELKGYAEAIKTCCQDEQNVRQIIAVLQASENQEFDRGDLERALDSKNAWLALSAIDALNNISDTVYARERLTRLLLDERDPIANRAREVLRKGK